ncbi:hypothetical protein FRC17_001329 [Serendipita sp. 399]|nr:hypothetical protein FRC17_001329 [Serendipita sp. 399]
MLAKALILSSAALLASAATYDVKVGGLDASGNPVLKFDPEYVNAVVGDQVVFHFQQKNHSVVQTTFGSVCQPLLNEQYAPVFATPFHPVSNEETNFPTETYTVTDASKPLWFYCSQKTHCGKGMIFSINCPVTGDNSLDAFRNRALALGQQEAAASSSAAAWSATATPDVYAGQTYPPIYHPTVTQTVTLGTETWTTTYESWENSPPPTPVAQDGVTHTVIVGKGGAITYDPPSIKAAPRDTIRFVFQSRNHTITQSSFGNPCRKLEFTSTTGEVGFDSGFVPGKEDGTAFYEVKVNDTRPLYAYCRQTGHCGQGMVFGVNLDDTSARSFVAFQNLAKTINGTTGGGASGGSSTAGGSGSSGGSNAAGLGAHVGGGLFGVVLAGVGAAVAVLL